VSANFGHSGRSNLSSTHVSSPLNRSVFTVTFQARKCSTQFEGFIVFRNRARNATLYLTFSLEIKEVRGGTDGVSITCNFLGYSASSRSVKKDVELLEISRHSNKNYKCFHTVFPRHARTLLCRKIVACLISVFSRYRVVIAHQCMSHPSGARSLGYTQ
jgi:hypothetical protein